MVYKKELKILTKNELKILKKFKSYSPIENEDEEKILKRYSLIGWVHWGIDPADDYKPYAQLTEKGLTHVRVEEILESKVRIFWHKLINFAT